MRELFEGAQSVVVFYSRVRFLCWPLFVVLTFAAVEGMLRSVQIMQGWHPFISISPIMMVFQYSQIGATAIITGGALYFGYRCVANEADHRVLELNQCINRIFLENITGKR